MRRRAGGGYTLVEVLVASVVALLVLGEVWQLMATGGQIYLRGKTRSDLQDAAVAALNDIGDELRRSAFGLLTVADSSSDAVPALAFRMQDPHDPLVEAFNPAPYFVLYSFDGTGGRLVRKTWSSTDGDPVKLASDPFNPARRLTFAEVEQIVAAPNGTERPVAGNVAAFSVTPSRYPITTPVVSVGLTVTLHETVASTAYSETAATTVVLRNKL